MGAAVLGAVALLGGSAAAEPLSGFPGYYSLYDEVDLARSGKGFTADPPTATFDGKIHTMHGEWPPVDWLFVPHHKKYELAEGTYSAAWYVVRWWEQSGINKEVDVAGPSLPPGHMDFQLGGDKNGQGARIHGRVGGKGRDERGSWEGTYCQWVHVVMRWGGGRDTDFWVNGKRRHAVPYAGGFERNTADWVLGANRKIKKGRVAVSHQFGGAHFEPVVFPERLSDRQVETLYRAQFGHLPATHHRRDVSGRKSPFGKKGRVFYKCDHDPAELLPKSLADLDLAAATPADGRAAASTAAAPAKKAPSLPPASTFLPNVPSSKPATIPAPAAAAAPAAVRQAGLPALTVEGGDTDIAVFGHPFAPGDLPAGAGLTLGGAPIQVDVKARHADGSARHAIIAARPGAGRLAAAPAGRCDALAQARALTDGGWRFEVTVNGRSVDIPALIAADLRDGRLDVFLTCPTVSQYRVSRNLSTTLRLTADVTAYPDGRVRTDVMLDSASLHTWETQQLKVSMVQDGKPVYAREQEQWRHTSWRHRVWRGGASAAYPIRDAGYLVGTGAMPRYDSSIKPDLSDILDRYAVIADGVAPMGSPLNVHKMRAGGQTSGNEIGPMTAEQVLYLLSQDPRALAVIEAYAFGAASIGWHWRDPATDEMALQRPTGGLDRDISRTGEWQADQAHQPAFNYAPYLWTGDRWYLDLLHFQANSSMFDRRGAMLLGQVRSTAWKMRDLATAAYITPDDHPFKSYFTGYLAHSMAEWKRLYIDSGDYDFLGEIRGFHWRQDDRVRGKISPWMEDFVTVVLAWMVDMDVDGAREILAWKAGYTLGRLEPHDGWSPYSGVSYRHGVADPETGKLTRKITKWSQIWDADEKGIENGRPHRASNYFDVTFAAVKSICNALPSERARSRVQFMRDWMRQAGGGLRGAWSRIPKWAITSDC